MEQIKIEEAVFLKAVRDGLSKKKYDGWLDDVKQMFDNGSKDLRNTAEYKKVVELVRHRKINQIIKK